LSFKITVIDNQKLNFGLKNDLCPYNFFKRIMDDHSKREGLETFILRQKSVFILCFLLNPSPTRQIFAILRKMTT